MTKAFVSDEINQSLMMPPSLHDWLPEDHLARFVADLVPSLDLKAFYSSHEEKDWRGMAAYHPVMMVRLLVYGYCIGVVSSRQIEKRTYEDVAFRYLSADEHPHYTTINEFRKRHLKALEGLFLQVLELCQAAGLVKMGHVALDGTKKQANASKHKAMSYGRMGEAEERLRAQVKELLDRAEAADAAEDEMERQGYSDKLPAELARRESRLKKIAEAKAALEAEARRKAEEKKAQAEARIAERQQQDQETGKKIGGRPPQVPDPEQARPEDSAQRNFTDPDSRIMADGANKGSFVQAYNAQIAVDAEAQIIVAADVTQEVNDKQQLAPMFEQVEKNTGAKPAAGSADTAIGLRSKLPISALKAADFSPRWLEIDAETSQGPMKPNLFRRSQSDFADAASCSTAPLPKLRSTKPSADKKIRNLGISDLPYPLQAPSEHRLAFHLRFLLRPLVAEPT